MAESDDKQLSMIMSDWELEATKAKRVKKEENPVDQPSTSTQKKPSQEEALTQPKNLGGYNYSCPHKFGVNTTLKEFIEKYNGLKDGEVREIETVCVAGTIGAIRRSEANLVFYDLQWETNKLQIVATAKTYESEDIFTEDTEKFRRGDFIGVQGFPTKTKNGELSIIPKKIKILSPCAKMFTSVLDDEETKSKKMYYVNLTLNRQVKNFIYTRSKIVAYIRSFLNELNFLEVDALHMNMIVIEAHKPSFMQMATGLLSFNRIYKIRKPFSDEINYSARAPDFSCEVYETCTRYNEVLYVIESLVSGIVKQIHGTYIIIFHSEELEGEEFKIDFTPPFKKVKILPTIEQALNVKLPTDFTTEGSRKFLDDLCIKNNIECAPPRTTEKLLDRLIAVFVEAKCINPTFIMEHPQILSPLAKYHKSEPGLTERFELFVMRKVLCNAYAEVNMCAQRANREVGDDMAQSVEGHFCTLLNCLFPHGWGLDVHHFSRILSPK